MELGLSRREALQNLKRRTDVPELSNFVLAIVQADALGMPIGRVLKTQATEHAHPAAASGRGRRRASCRSRSCSRSSLFIFPAILVVVLGPAVISFSQNF